ncbi:MAG: glycosyltransferase [Acidobacteriota bacterium]
MDRAPAPVVVAGMHRSGTSLVASWVQALGIDVGSRLLEADAANSRGYFEDRDFVELHQRMFWEATRPDDGGHRDWGWTESETLDHRVFARHRAAAAELVSARRARREPWGWKDPRTSLTLDFWDELVPDARFVFVYRYPWDVGASMERLGAEVFVGRPDYAFHIWNAYNRALLAFMDARPERCLLLAVHSLTEDPEATAHLIQSRLGASEPSHLRAAERLEPALLHAMALDDPYVQMARELHPASMRLLAELELRAGSAGATMRPPPARRQAASTPLLSVVIPYHNDGELLIEALASVERSVPVAHETIVIDDGSTDALSLHVLGFLRARGATIVNQEQAGLGAARNAGFQQARADYVLPLDADNRLLPGFVESALALMAGDPRIIAVYGDRQDFGLRRGLVEVPEFDLFRLLQGNFIDACALVRKRAWAECDGYDADMPALGWEDWDLWLGAAERGWSLVHLALPAFEYRVRASSMSSRLMEPAVGRALQAYIVRKHEKLYAQFLPSLLEVAQGAKREPPRPSPPAPELETLREELRALRLWAEEHSRASISQTTRLSQDNEALQAELARWEQRTAAMERTRAWRARAALLRLRSSLR